MPRRAAKVDANHGEVRDALRKCGWTVLDTSHVGHGFPDLMAARSRTGLVLIEVKDGAKSASRRKLTPDQVAMHAMFASAGVAVVVVESVEQAVRL